LGALVTSVLMPRSAHVLNRFGGCCHTPITKYSGGLIAIDLLLAVLVCV
jgi:hypothetical protein